MQSILYLDESSNPGKDRFHDLARVFGNDVSLEFLDASAAPANVASRQQWDLIVADMRGLAAPQQVCLDKIIERDPDAALVLIAETLDGHAADAMLRHSAIDCLIRRREASHFAESIRRLLTRVTLTRRAIRLMDSCIEELDVTITVDRSPKSANSLATYALRHLARMEVCGLRSQFRAVRAFEEVLETLLQNVRAQPAGITAGSASRSSQPAHDAPGADQSSDSAVGRVRIHLSRAGLRFTLRSEGVLPLQPQDRKSADDHGFPGLNHLWFAPLLMDQIAIGEDPHELTMLKLPDDVCCEVSRAIALRRNSTGGPDHDVLGDVLEFVEVSDETNRG